MKEGKKVLVEGEEGRRGRKEEYICSCMCNCCIVIVAERATVGLLDLFQLKAPSTIVSQLSLCSLQITFLQLLNIEKW